LGNAPRIYGWSGANPQGLRQMLGQQAKTSHLARVTKFNNSGRDKINTSSIATIRGSQSGMASHSRSVVAKNKDQNLAWPGASVEISLITGQPKLKNTDGTA